MCSPSHLQIEVQSPSQQGFTEKSGLQINNEGKHSLQEVLQYALTSSRWFNNGKQFMWISEDLAVTEQRDKLIHVNWFQKTRCSNRTFTHRHPEDGDTSMCFVEWKKHSLYEHDLK